MQKLKYTYEDPTGGGDEAELILPITWNPPSRLRVTDQSGDGYVMELADEEGEEVEDE